MINAVGLVTCISFTSNTCLSSGIKREEVTAIIYEYHFNQSMEVRKHFNAFTNISETFRKLQTAKGYRLSRALLKIYTRLGKTTPRKVIINCMINIS